ncbi:MAG: sulfotransferase domain-containing protein, partial [Bacteroidota bacterium]
TTWLGNILSQKFNIKSAYHPLHYGIHHITVIGFNNYFGEFNSKRKYVEFLNQAIHSDLFKLCEGDEAYFRAHPQKDFYHFYFELLDQYALKYNKQHWLSKFDVQLFAHPKELEKFVSILNERYESFKVVGVQRNYKGFINSSLNLGDKEFQFKQSAKGKAISIISASARYFDYYSQIPNFVKKHNGLQLSFDEMKNDHLATLNKIAAYLEIPLQKVETKLIKNTSYQKKGLKKDSSHPLIGISETLLKVGFIRKFVIRFLNYRRSKLKPQNPIYYRLLRAEHYKEDLIEEMTKTNNDVIADIIKAGEY